MAYAGGRLTGRYVLGNLDEPVDAPVPAGAFGAGTRPLARAGPLRAGYTATFRIVDKSGDAATRVHVAVVEMADGAWPVTVATPGGPATTSTPSTPRRAPPRVRRSRPGPA